MSSIQRLLGLPRPLTPPTRPWSIDVARFCDLTMCLKYFSFCLRTSVTLDLLSLGVTCWFCAPSSWCGGFFCTPSSQMLLTSSCLQCSLQCPRFTTIHCHWPDQGFQESFLYLQAEVGEDRSGHREDRSGRYIWHKDRSGYGPKWVGTEVGIPLQKHSRDFIVAFAICPTAPLSLCCILPIHILWHPGIPKGIYLFQV